MKIIKKQIISAVTAVVIIISAVVLYLFYHNEKNYTSTFFALDTIVSLNLSEDFTDEIKETIESFNSICDIYSENSEIFLLNQTKSLRCSDTLTNMITGTLKLNQEYGNRLDISSGNINMLWNKSLENNKIPEYSEILKCLETSGCDKISINQNQITLSDDISIDTGSVAKGFVLDEVIKLCTEKSPSSAIISLGSSTLLYSNDSNRTFNVGVKAGKDSIAGMAVTKSCFVSTSGNYERCTEINGTLYHHIIDLQTGYPSESGLSSVTVFCDNGLMSDFLSTLIFIEGKENLRKHLCADKYKIIAIDTEGKIFKSDSLDFRESY